jgi:drug/metabolite transporter (DMT)-like permease
MFGSLDTRARLACFYAGAMWGLFWVPLRHMAEAGIHEVWITPLYFLVPTVIALPLVITRLPSIMRGGITLQLTMLASGTALTLYSTSIVYTDVVRAIMLFYLMPFWSIVLARIFLKEEITPVRIVSMILGAIGLLVLFGLGAGWPIPRNVGDWIGLFAGFFWAVTTVRMRKYEEQSSIDLTIGFFVWSVILSSAIAVMLVPLQFPSMDQVISVLPVLGVFMLLIIVPGTYASLWGPKFVNPGVSGLLFMSEIVVGAISVALLAGEPFGSREMAGVILIAGASLLEPLMNVIRRS